MNAGTPRRCAWAERGSAAEREYHDREWGVPCRDDGKLFEFLVLESAQAGLSWRTILHKRAAYRRAFAGFDPARVARFDAARIERLLADPGIVRNRAKIEAAVHNARCFLEVQARYGRFADFLWAYVDGRPQVNRHRRADEVPATTPLAERLSRDLKRLGFRFVGPVVCYAYLQAMGLVNDHTLDCFRHAELARSR
ncbi:MAG: DNA-3-methyladenine glycosylase I [Gammaproteobacteria bacterium]|nr:MAG: DNA-3-methyladenine glycosylase I [Gammaproteobacteria bacterium]